MNHSETEISKGNELTGAIIGAAIEVHRHLGLGYWNPCTKNVWC